MIDVTKLTQDEITQLGIDVLALALGPAGMGLFMHQFEKGSGDYTRDRDKILGNPTIEEIVARIKLHASIALGKFRYSAQIHNQENDRCHKVYSRSN